jgi:hypothetical protein
MDATGILSAKGVGAENVLTNLRLRRLSLYLLITLQYLVSVVVLRATRTALISFLRRYLKSHLMFTTIGKQEVLAITDRVLSLIRHGPHKKRRVQQFFYCCVCICCRGNIFTEPLPSNDNGFFIEPFPINDKEHTD